MLLTKRDFLKSCLGGAAWLSTDLAFSQTVGSRSFRPPSVPLIVTDPYFSIWSNSDLLNDAPTQHWTRHNQRLTGLCRIDGQCYRVMGDEPKGMPALLQTSVTVHPTRSIYEFAGSGVQVRLTFMTAALPYDLMLLSRPVAHLTWSVRSTDGASHSVALYIDASSEIAVNEPTQTVGWSAVQSPDLLIQRAGCVEQNMMNPAGDDVRADWGYLYVAARQQDGVTQSAAHPGHLWNEFSRHGSVPQGHAEGRQVVGEEGPVLALSCNLGAIDGAEKSWTAFIAYDEVYAIQYFEQNLHPYWRRKGASAIDLLHQAMAEHESLVHACESFDRELLADARQLGGEKYAQICALAYRQCVAGVQIVADTNGQPLLFPKENTSNGCIGTVDVIYPMAPQFLLFGPSLSKAMLISNLQYASSARWPFPFAPHDLGTFPQANGQVYGGGEKTEENQMPVEETGNMLILLAALAQMEGNAEFVHDHWPTIQKWAQYLKAEGFDPKNQLCTDDFAGHLAHNVNLSAKAIVGLGAYAVLCRLRHDDAGAAEFTSLAQHYASRWAQEANGGDHFGLTFDNAQATWSQKYNLVWDRLLGLNLFPSAVLEKEIAFYRRQFKQYGLPLDSRKPWTKLDWALWTATLSSSQSDFEHFVEIVWNFLNTTPDRVPMSDFYWTQNAQDAGMHARPVVGGVFLRFLYEKALWTKWSSRDQTKASGWAAFPSSAFPA